MFLVARVCRGYGCQDVSSAAARVQASKADGQNLRNSLKMQTMP